MWVLVLVVVLATVVIVASLSYASDNIIEELQRISRPNHDDNISKYDLADFEIAVTDIKELLSISCPHCGDKPWDNLTVPEQRVWLEEHMAEHKDGRLEKRTLDAIIAERHAKQEQKHKEWEASHKHLFSPEGDTEEGEPGE